MADLEFKDYDQAVAEAEDTWFEFRFGGEDFKVNFNVDGAVVLRWMRSARSPASIAQLLETLMGEDFKRLLATGQPWAKYEALLVDVFAEIGGTGNVRTPRETTSSTGTAGS